MSEDSTEGSYGGGVRSSLVQDISFSLAQDLDSLRDETTGDGLSRRVMKKAIRKRIRRKSGKPVRSGDGPDEPAKVAKVVDPAKAAGVDSLLDSDNGSGGK